MVRELMVPPSSPPPHGGFQQHQPVLDSPGHGLEVDGVEVPAKDMVKSLYFELLVRMGRSVNVPLALFLWILHPLTLDIIPIRRHDKHYVKPFLLGSQRSVLKHITVILNATRGRGGRCSLFLTMRCFPILNDAIFSRCLKKHRKSAKLP